MEKIYIFFKTLELILGAIKSVLFEIAIGSLIIILIINFVDTTWLRWLLLIMFGGALFYSVYDDLVLYFKEELIKTLSKDKKLVVPTKKEAIWNWAKAIFWTCLCVGVWIYYFEHQESKKRLANYGIKYELISEEKLDEKVCMKGGCSTTVKKVLSSNDGFIFETFLSDGSDSVWCGALDNKWSDTENPCSTVGDYGGGRDVMNVISKKTNKLITITSAGANVERIPTPMDYPYLVFKTNTGGTSGAYFWLYTKEDLKSVPSSTSTKYSR